VEDASAKIFNKFFFFFFFYFFLMVFLILERMESYDEVQVEMKMHVKMFILE